MKYILILMLSALIGCAQNKEISETQGKSELHLDSKKVVLQNGLTVILVKNSKLPIFSYYTFYKVGSKFEQKGLTGATHYLEHMMFKSTKNRKDGTFDKIIEGNGGTSNAYTTNDLTVYHENMPVDALNYIIEAEADRMANMILEKVPFEKERSVVLEERKMRYENSPRGKLFLEMTSRMFAGTPYGTSVIGNIEDLLKVTPEQMFEYYKQFYVPNNAILVISGDINEEQVLNKIKEQYEKIPSGPNLAKYKNGLDQLDRYRFSADIPSKIALKGEAPSPMFAMGFQGIPHGTSSEGYALDLMMKVLADGDSSYLQQALVKNDRPLLTNLYAWNWNLAHSGILLFGGQLMTGVGIDQLQAEMLKTIDLACNKAIDERSVQKAKNQLLISLYRNLETNDGIAHLLGLNEVIYGDRNQFLHELEIYEKLNVDDIKKACGQFLVGKKSLFISLWNQQKV